MQTGKPYYKIHGYNRNVYLDTILPFCNRNCSNMLMCSHFWFHTHLTQKPHSTNCCLMYVFHTTESGSTVAVAVVWGHTFTLTIS